MNYKKITSSALAAYATTVMVLNWLSVSYGLPFIKHIVPTDYQKLVVETYSSDELNKTKVSLGLLDNSELSYVEYLPDVLTQYNGDVMSKTGNMIEIVDTYKVINYDEALFRNAIETKNINLIIDHLEYISTDEIGGITNEKSNGAITYSEYSAERHYDFQSDYDNAFDTFVPLLVAGNVFLIVLTKEVQKVRK